MSWIELIYKPESIPTELITTEKKSSSKKESKELITTEKKSSSKKESKEWVVLEDRNPAKVIIIQEEGLTVSHTENFQSLRADYLKTTLETLSSYLTKVLPNIDQIVDENESLGPLSNLSNSWSLNIKSVVLTNADTWNSCANCKIFFDRFDSTCNCRLCNATLCTKCGVKPFKIYTHVFGTYKSEKKFTVKACDNCIKINTQLKLRHDTSKKRKEKDNIVDLYTQLDNCRKILYQQFEMVSQLSSSPKPDPTTLQPILITIAKEKETLEKITLHIQKLVADHKRTNNTGTTKKRQVSTIRLLNNILRQIYQFEEKFKNQLNPTQPPPKE